MTSLESGKKKIGNGGKRGRNLHLLQDPDYRREIPSTTSFDLQKEKKGGKKERGRGGGKRERQTLF